MSFAGFGKSRLNFDMFDLERSADEARRAQKMSSLYHRGQELAWDGRAVLADLIAQHGGIHVDPKQRDALAAVFGVIMWGELAAWKISLQLADGIPELEPKMAATSQAHDEARHFYVMYDYLTALGHVPKSMDRASRVLLDLVLETDSLEKKLLGMQLMVESLALTIFQAVREARLEPVLADLLRYYEKDEARHVGLGVQLLPVRMRKMTRREGLSLFAFQVELVVWQIAALRSLAPHLVALGIDPRRVLTLGRAKQTLAVQELDRQLGINGIPKTRELVVRSVNALSEIFFPRTDGDDSRSLWRKLRDGWRLDLDDGLPETSLDPTAAPIRVSVARGHRA